MSVEKPYVFISHSSHDNQFAREVAVALRSSELNVWVDFESIPYGERWSHSIESAISDSDSILVIMSKAARASEWVERELLFALELRKQIFVVLIDESSIPLYLIDRQHADLRRNKSIQIKQLIERIKMYFVILEERNAIDAELTVDESQLSGDPSDVLIEIRDQQSFILQAREQDRITLEQRNQENNLIEIMSGNTTSSHSSVATVRKLIYWGSLLQKVLINQQLNRLLALEFAVFET